MKIGINGLGRMGRLALRAAMGGVRRAAGDPRAGNRLDVVHLNEVKGGATATAHLETQIRELDARLHQANHAIQTLGRDFRVAVRAILATAGNVPDADLDDWTQSNLSNPDDLDLKSHP